MELNFFQRLFLFLYLMVQDIRAIFIDMYEILKENNAFTRVAIVLIGGGLVMLAIMFFYGFVLINTK